jgi:hypothetical protein
MNATTAQATLNGQVSDTEAGSTMHIPANPRSRKAVWTGRTLSALAVAFLGFDAALKLFAVPAAVEGTAQLGYPVSTLSLIATIQLICLAVYLIPRTAVIGAVLWTGYLGGAIATHVRVGSPLFTHILFPIYVAALIWGGLYLRDRRVSALLAPSHSIDR